MAAARSVEGAVGAAAGEAVGEAADGVVVAAVEVAYAGGDSERDDEVDEAGSHEEELDGESPLRPCFLALHSLAR
jgi:hypothetical protein